MRSYGLYLIQFFLFFTGISVSCIGAAEDNINAIEVLHLWNAGGEAKALTILKNEMITKGFLWKDSTIRGGGQQRRVLRARMNTMNPPDAVLTQYVPHFARDGFLDTLDDIARKDNWQSIIPKPIQESIRYRGHWMAVPLNIQRSNWIWANKRIFDALHLKPPKTFDELIEVARKIKQAGYIPFAHGGQDWQDIVFFDAALMSVGGASLYQKALIEFDLSVLKSKKMETVFERVLLLRQFFDKDFVGRDWNLATSMLIHNKAAMQVMGDWVKGEFNNAKQLPNRDYLCFEYPETSGSFLFSSDMFGILKTPQSHKYVQQVFVRTILAKDVQEKFNLIKGSIPVRQDIDMQAFDYCSQQSKIHFNNALKNNKVVERFDRALSEARRVAIFSFISQVIQKGNITAKEAAQRFVHVIQDTQ